MDLDGIKMPGQCNLSPGKDLSFHIRFGEVGGLTINWHVSCNHELAGSLKTGGKLSWFYKVRGEG